MTSAEFMNLMKKLRTKYGDENCEAFNRGYFVKGEKDGIYLFVTEGKVLEMSVEPEEMRMDDYIKLLDIPEAPAEDLTDSGQE